VTAVTTALAGRTRPAVSPVTRMRWELTLAPDRPARPSPLLRGKRVAVINGDPASAERVAAALRRAGAHATAVPPAPEGGLPEIPDALVDLTIARPLDADADYRAALSRSIAAIKACYRNWEAEDRTDRVGYLAVTYLGGGMGLPARVGANRPAGPGTGGGPAAPTQPLGGVWAGLAKSLHREIPNCNARIVDIDLAALDDLPDIVAHELYHWGLFEIGHRDGQRYTLVPRREPVAAPSIVLDDRDTVLMSGGGRGIGFRLARELAAGFGCRVVVTGRDDPPGGDEPWYGLDDARSRRSLRRSPPYAGAGPSPTTCSRPGVTVCGSSTGAAT
jgi:hypothetical protein